MPASPPAIQLLSTRKIRSPALSRSHDSSAGCTRVGGHRAKDRPVADTKNRTDRRTKGPASPRTFDFEASRQSTVFSSTRPATALSTVLSASVR